MTHPTPSQEVFPSAAFYIRPIEDHGPHDIHTSLRGRLTRQGKDWKFEGTAELIRCEQGFMGPHKCMITYKHDHWLDIVFIDQPVRVESSAWMTTGLIKLNPDPSVLGFQLLGNVAIGGHGRKILAGSSFELQV